MPWSRRRACSRRFTSDLGAVRRRRQQPSPFTLESGKSGSTPHRRPGRRVVVGGGSEVVAACRPGRGPPTGRRSHREEEHLPGTVASRRRVGASGRHPGEAHRQLFRHVSPSGMSGSRQCGHRRDAQGSPYAVIRRFRAASPGRTAQTGHRGRHGCRSAACRTLEKRAIREGFGTEPVEGLRGERTP